MGGLGLRVVHFDGRQDNLVGALTLKFVSTGAARLRGRVASGAASAANPAQRDLHDLEFGAFGL